MSPTPSSDLDVEPKAPSEEPSGNIGVDDFLQIASSLLPEGYRLEDDRDHPRTHAPNARPMFSGLDDPHTKVIKLKMWLDEANPSTMRAYCKRGKKFQNALERDAGTAQLIEFALYVLGRIQTVGSSSQRQYRNAVALFLVAQLRGDASERRQLLVMTAIAIVTARKLITDASENGKEGSQGRKTCKSKSLQKFDPDHFQILLNHFAEISRSSRRRRLTGLLLLGWWTGIRPIEARTLSIEVSKYGGSIFIRNAKSETGDGRGCGIWRYHHYDEQSDWDLVGPNIERGIALLGADVEAMSDAEWEIERDACQRLLRDTCRILRLPKYELYDLRHQFAADMKLHFVGALDRDLLIAALMGHASSRTANSHYARAGKGKVRIAPEADEAVIELVRTVDRSFINSTELTLEEPSTKPVILPH